MAKVVLGFENHALEEKQLQHPDSLPSAGVVGQLQRDNIKLLSKQTSKRLIPNEMALVELIHTSTIHDQLNHHQRDSITATTRRKRRETKKKGRTTHKGWRWKYKRSFCGHGAGGRRDSERWGDRRPTWARAGWSFRLLRRRRRLQRCPFCSAAGPSTSRPPIRHLRRRRGGEGEKGGRREGRGEGGGAIFATEQPRQWEGRERWWSSLDLGSFRWGPPWTSVEDGLHKDLAEKGFQFVYFWYE